MHDPTLSAMTAPAGAIRVRTCEPADLEAIAALMNLPGVRHGTLSSGWRTPESLRAWYDNHTPGSVRLCAEINARVVGNVTLMVGKPRRAHCGSLGIAVDDAFQGRGVGSALMAAIVDYADRSLGLRRIELEVYPDNAAAIALYRKFGFVEEGRSRGSSIRDGVLADTLHMARYADAPPFAEPSSS
ncbi:GNAT family N-acetyltransferase [Paraburkholderia acidipaludis]|uniref:GNAT family N-acetyltransferase n=1 Tax=Paraburkholderia acidipaludis TaxID=660537 RepID=UPI000487CE8D|nr:GNAT family N-acetyltransferase [Paraburkholderia acidipaludis]